MSGNVNSRTGALHKAGERDLRATEHGYHSNNSAEILPFRPPHNSNGAAHGLPLNDDQELVLMNLIKSGDFDTRQNLVTRNLRIVLKRNRRYGNMGVRIFDLLKAGNRGLEYAVENFEQEVGGCFSTYAASCICRNVENIILHRDVHRVANMENQSMANALISVAGCRTPSLGFVPG